MCSLLCLLHGCFFVRLMCITLCFLLTTMTHSVNNAKCLEISRDTFHKSDFIILCKCDSIGASKTTNVVIIRNTFEIITTNNSKTYAFVCGVQWVLCVVLDTLSCFCVYVVLGVIYVLWVLRFCDKFFVFSCLSRCTSIYIIAMKFKLTFCPTRMNDVGL